MAQDQTDQQRADCANLLDLDGRIRARRDALAAQLAAGQAQYAELERTLGMLQRQLDAMHGGVQELDALLTVVESVTAGEKAADGVEAW